MASKNKSAIVNKVLDAPTVPWGQVKDFEANRLKAGEKRNVAKLKKVILEEGFCFPLFVWQAPDKLPSYVIDGAGRIQALRQLEKEGHVICDLPVVFIQADSKEQAKKLVTLASSQYGIVDAESFASFVQEMPGGAGSLLPSVSISSMAFATDYMGMATGKDGDGPKRNKKKVRYDAEIPEFEPTDIIEAGPHQLIVGFEKPDIIKKIIVLLRKDFPDLQLTRNGEAF